VQSGAAARCGQLRTWIDAHGEQHGVLDQVAAIERLGVAGADCGYKHALGDGLGQLVATASGSRGAE
jgi:hypothetical protein